MSTTTKKSYRVKQHIVDLFNEGQCFLNYDPETGALEGEIWTPHGIVCVRVTGNCKIVSHSSLIFIARGIYYAWHFNYRLTPDEAREFAFKLVNHYCIPL